MPKFSIIIATYNASEHLQETLNSIFNQTYNDYEILIIDGNSKDNTFNIIKYNRDKIHYYVSEEDDGLYDAWNKGILKVTSKWVMFLGAGDVLKNDALQNYNLFLNDNGDDFDYVSAKLNRIGEKGDYLSTFGQRWDWEKSKHIMNVAHPGSLHSIYYFKKIGCFNTQYKICADYEFLLRNGEEMRTSFMDKVIVDMPIGGCSFSNKAIIETFKIKYAIKNISRYRTISNAIMMFLKLRFFKIKHINKD